jgi:hypothetical protein
MNWTKRPATPFWAFILLDPKQINMIKPMHYLFRDCGKPDAFNDFLLNGNMKPRLYCRVRGKCLKLNNTTIVQPNT